MPKRRRTTRIGWHWWLAHQCSNPRASTGGQGTSATRSAWFPAVLAVALGTLGPAARGELLYFEAGGEAQLPAVVRGNSVLVDAPDGRHTFLRKDFRAIVPGHCPPRDWPSIRVAAEAGDAEDRYRAAWWALDRGLVDDASAMLRIAHEADPSLEPVARLVEVLDRLDVPAESPDLGSIRRTLPNGFRVLEGPHVALLHRHDEAEARDRVALLESVLTAFYLNFEARGFELRPPESKLVAVWFPDPASYGDWIANEAGDAFRTTRGYYHPTRRIVVTDDDRGHDTHQHALKLEDSRRRAIEAAARSLDLAPRGARVRLELAGAATRVLDTDQALDVLDDLRRDLDRRCLLRDLDRRRRDDGTAAHELVHQLVVASGLAPRFEAFPIWLHEGLATQFEGIQGGRWAGLGDLQGARLGAWNRLESPPDLEPLLRDRGFGLGYDADRYAAAWALVHHLRHRHPEGFVALLDLLRHPEPGLPPADRAVDAFRTAIGPDLIPFRRAWHRDIATLRPPLESQRPAEMPR